jgi:hypothetical protein
VFDDWADAQPKVSGVRGCLVRGFDSSAEAQAFVDRCRSNAEKMKESDKRSKEVAVK